MLDAETKRKIDSARDILVGKVPDPKAQVEQITTALIYKFMDDMDREAEELGGKATFLTGELEIYQWANLMSKELGGEARLNLYMSALLAFSKTPNIPEIFRTIFKDAFLPYRDPETLNLFLKQIDWFDYDHSENLGDAFEYLLSVLGSQGDAGQFRTPRHIIDFIVEVIEPKKTETVLDPSCGTAGFLISAYKHILASNDALTPDEKKQLVQHFTGYDISPDMVRLSLVNLYLHSFPSPKVYEYDTLTSEDRWQESFDVILANPPFMSPKGGIRPHSRFSVQANRSEVLFVDYIAEHLNLNGRAGIIVPEGIIFQSANAYKALRKMLVDNGLLWAVVSLPAGVFQPYSGVKTSILLLDRSIAKRSNEILFIKIASDGYDLGAQRRENTTSDLPTALEILKAHRHGEAVDNAIVQVVAKAKIAETGDYNLTGDRYRETKARDNGVYPLVKLGDVCEFVRGITFSTKDHAEENYVLVATTKAAQSDGLRIEHLVKIKSDIIKNEKLYLQNGDLLISTANSSNLLGRKTFIKNIEDKKLSFGAFMGCLRTNNELILANFLNPFLESDSYKKFCLSRANTTTNISNLNWTDLSQFEIPLPPLEIQDSIVAEIEQWQKVIDGAKQVVANYRPTISIKPDWEMIELGKICNIKSGSTPSRRNNKYFENGIHSWVKTLDLNNSYITETDEKITAEAIKNSSCEILPVGTVLIAMYGGFNQIGRTGVLKIEAATNQAIAAILPNDKILPEFLNYIFIVMRDEWKKIANSTRKDPNITQQDVKNFKIPLPILEIQNTLVEQIEKERAAVESCKTIIALFEAKIKTKIAEVWGEAE